MKDDDCSDFLPQMFCGAMSGLISRVVSAPLDVLKIRFQLQNSHVPKYTSIPQAIQTIITEEGFAGLWKGNIPAMYLWGSYSAFQFSAYAAIQRQGNAFAQGAGITDTSNCTHAAVNFVSGAGAAVIATTVTYPFDIMRTQFAIQGDQIVHTTMVDYVVHTHRHNQLPGFFRGLPAAVAGIVPFMGLNFAIYEFLKQKGQQLHSLRQLCEEVEENKSVLSCNAVSLLISGSAGGVSGGMSKLAVYPLDTVKKRMQVQVLSSTFEGGRGEKFQGGKHLAGNPFYSIGSCFRAIFRNEGVLGFYKGIVPTLTKSVVSTAVTFYVYDGCLMLLKSSSLFGRRDTPS